MFVNRGWENVIAALRFIPGVSRVICALKLNTFKPKETRFFRDTVVRVIKQRQLSGERKNDLIDLMIDSIKDDAGGNKNKAEAEETDMINVDSVPRAKAATGGVKVDEELVVATAMVLLIAGYDTTGITLAYLMYELAMHPEVQAKLQAEVDEAYEGNNGVMPDYSVIQGLPYLEMVILETLRLHPPLGMIVRACTQAGLGIFF
jgi:cytochrome P450